MTWLQCHQSLLFLCFLWAAIITHGSTAEIPISISIGSQVDDDLTSSLINGQIHQPDVYSRAVSILEALESAPSCHRIATMSLIKSCQSLDKSTPTEAAVSEIREEYATKLAMCELNAAKVTVSRCNDFIPSTKACKKFGSGGFFKRQQKVGQISGKFCYPEVCRAQVKQCISALSSRPQWWTSYSNALQNVVVVCQASRSAIEKDEILEQFKRAAEVGSDVTEALAESLNHSKSFIASIQALHSQVLQDWVDEAARSRTVFGQLLLNVQISVHTMIESFRQGADEASDHMSKLKEDINEGHRTTTEMNTALRGTMSAFNEMDAAQREAWQRVGNKANEVGHTLETLNNNVPQMQQVMRVALQHFEASAADLAVLHTELEAQILRNNDKLVLQEHLIQRFKTARSFDIIQPAMLVLASYIILRSVNWWIAFMTIAAAVAWLTYRAFAAIPFIHLATPIFLSYSDIARHLWIKILVIFVLALVLGFVLSVLASLWQAYVATSRIRTYNQALVQPLRFPQAQLHQVNRRHVQRPQALYPQVRCDPLERNMRAQSSPPKL